MEKLTFETLWMFLEAARKKQVAELDDNVKELVLAVKPDQIVQVYCASCNEFMQITHVSKALKSDMQIKKGQVYFVIGEHESRGTL